MNSTIYKRIAKALAAIGMLIVIVIPGEVLHLVLEILHLIWEYFVELLHLLFEGVEMTLDTVIELLFETDLRSTQIIVFYIIASIIGYMLYRLCRKIPAWFLRMKTRLLAWYYKKLSEISTYWHNLSLLEKTKLIAMTIGVCYAMIFFSL